MNHSYLRNYWLRLSIWFFFKVLYIFVVLLVAAVCLGWAAIENSTRSWFGGIALIILGAYELWKNPDWIMTRILFSPLPKKHARY